ncbi:uncharacterized protein [Paramormyrops kingsleyae]|uniref:uncharacterized protein n=1 Tax=Paramormyrops kingsleyae TaxID=1676925 RepID=UPI003B96BD90
MESQVLAERYLLRLTLYDTENHHSVSDGCMDLLVPTETISARVTNLQEAALTIHSVVSLARSLPYLHCRVMGDPYRMRQVYPSFLQVDILPPNYTPPERNTSPQFPHATPMDVTSEGITTSPSDWMQCDGSFVPHCSAPSGGEWTTVNFGDQTCFRFFAPVSYTENYADIVGRCTLTDYTAYGDCLFSVVVDLLTKEEGT